MPTSPTPTRGGGTGLRQRVLAEVRAARERLAAIERLLDQPSAQPPAQRPPAPASAAPRRRGPYRGRPRPASPAVAGVFPDPCSHCAPYCGPHCPCSCHRPAVHQ